MSDTDVIIVFAIVSVFVVLGIIGIVLHSRQSTEEMLRTHLSNELFDKDHWS